MPDESFSFKPRRGSQSTMTTAEKQSLLLESGEFFLEYPSGGVGTGASKVKIGDGVTTYSNLPYALGEVSDKANTLATARTIALSGGATGTATSFDGSANITIPVTSLDAAKLSGTASVDTTGNAGTASAIKTARTIALSGGATGTATSFDGSANISIPVTALDATVLSGTASINTTGNAGTANKLAATKTIALSGGATGTATAFDGSANITIPVTALDATKLSGTASIDTTGNAGTATKLAATKTISLSGGATGTATSFDGSTDITIPVTAIDANSITGIINITNLPQGSLERCVVVADDTARYALTTDTVQLGDTVKVTESRLMYFVKDESNLANSNGYEIYTSGAATSVPWSGITDKPSTYPPSGHTHLYAGSATAGGAATTALACTGNAATATALATARTIALSGGATGTATSFDGTGNITIPVTALDATKLTGTATISTSGNAGTATKLATGRTIAISGGVTGTATTFDGSAAISIPVTSLDATKLSGTATIATTGNAGTATKLATARTIALSGGVTGTATSFNGTANITIPVTAVDGSYTSGTFDFGSED